MTLTIFIPVDDSQQLKALKPYFVSTFFFIWNLHTNTKNNQFTPPVLLTKLQNLLQAKPNVTSTFYDTP